MLEKFPLFSDLSAEQVLRLERISKKMPLKKGALIFSPGDTAQGFFAVLVGAVRLYRISSQGKEISIEIIGTGHTFAEASLFSDIYHCYAEALKDSRVCLIQREAFIELIQRDSKFATAWFRVLSDKVIHLHRQIEELSLKTPKSRIVGYILFLAEIQNSESVLLPAHRKFIATLLGMTHETFYRTARELENEGMVRFEGDRIEIMDRLQMEDLVE